MLLNPLQPDYLRGRAPMSMSILAIQVNNTPRLLPLNARETVRRKTFSLVKGFPGSLPEPYFAVLAQSVFFLICEFIFIIEIL